jgi:2'-5' RNA ligase
MYIDIALLINREVQNTVRKLTLNLYLEYCLDLVATLLPQHVSIKSAFQVDKIEDIESYFDTFAQRIEPFAFELQNIELINFEKEGSMRELIWMNIAQNDYLMKLHAQINKDLTEMGIPLSPFDGDAFNFHSTLFYRASEKVSLEVYEKAFLEIKEKNLSLICQPREIALFCSPTNQKNLFESSFIYKVLPIGFLK